MEDLHLQLPPGDEQVAVSKTSHDRPRASSRPWLTFKYQVRLPSFKTRLGSSPPEDKSHEIGKQTKTDLSSKSRGTLTGTGLDLKTKIFSASGRGRTFFLTSLFIERIGHFEDTQVCGLCRMTGIHVSHCQQKSTRFSGRSGGCAIDLIRICRCATLPLGFFGPCSLQNRTSICCLRLQRVRTED
jgi:hypothetical protein